MKHLIQYLIIVILAGLVSACGGGSASQEPAAAAAPAPIAATKATVSIVLTDASIDDYDHAWVSISSVELIGDSAHELIFSGDRRVDLLALRDNIELFAVSEDVTPGTFSKVRMQASGMVLVVDNDDDTTTETPVDLVANGKIDLNPRGEFTLAAGDVVFISLDWDMRESMKLTETGNGNGKIKMRPVIFVDIGTAPAFKGGLVRVFGQINLIASDSTVFRLCSPDVMTQLPTTPVLGSLCLDVIINESTGVFNAEGEPTDIMSLGVDSFTTVVGLLQRSVDGPVVTPMEDTGGPVTPTTFQVVAIVVEGGDKDVWTRTRGTLKSTVAAETGQFDYLADNVEVPEKPTDLTGQLFDTSRIFTVAVDTGVTEITAVELAVDDRAAVDAVFKKSDDEAIPGTLNIALMLSRTPGDLALDHIKGEILSIDSATQMSISTNTDLGVVTVCTDDTTKIFEVFVYDDVVESHMVALDELSVGSKVAASGTTGDCFAAVLIIAEGQATTQ